MSPENGQRHVVVVGGGFAGVGCARRLAGEEGVRVTLIDRNNYHQFQPLLYQVATAELATADIARPLRGIFAKDETVAVKKLTVTSIDPAKRSVTTTDGQTFTADHLVLAAGSRPNFFNTPGAEEHAFPLKTLEDAVGIRAHLIRQFEAADRDAALVDAGALTVAIVGGGATGVEMAGALVELIDRVLVHDYPDTLLAEHEAPCLSLYQPTHRHHPDNTQDPIRFRNLVKQLAESLRANLKRRKEQSRGRVSVPREQDPGDRDDPG